MLLSEIDTIRQRFHPHQLAVRVKSGVEVMPHAARQWMTDRENNLDAVLIDSDETNAHNLVDRHTFMSRAREVMPRSCQLLQFIHPTDAGTLAFYQGRDV